MPYQSRDIVQRLAKHGGMAVNEVLLTLHYIKRLQTFEETGDRFGMSASSACKIFHRTLPVLVKFLKPFVHWPDSYSIRYNLPMAFRRRFSDVQSIIDTFEIEIEKPQRAMDQVFFIIHRMLCCTY